MSDVPDRAARADYFASGEGEVRDTLRVLRQLAGPSFQQDRILDFGCGDGRLTIPFGRVAQSVVGIGLDESAVVESTRNCRDAGLSNVTFVRSRPGLAEVTGPFEVVHSRDVFPSLEPSVGYPYANDLLDRVTPRGGGMLHFTYASSESPGRGSIARRSQEVFLRILHGEIKEPATDVFDYDLGRLFGMLQSKRFDRVATRFTDQDGRLGVKLFFWRGY